jgi:hypothetical protein
VFFNRFLSFSFQPHATDAQEEKGYKRVAIVEDFFDIIYDVHVEMDGRGGKHAGQKRTYRAVSNKSSPVLN